MTTLKFSTRKFLATLFVALLPVMGFASVPATAESGASPTGENLGFRFIGIPTYDGTLNTHGAFMTSDGVGLDLCGQYSGGSSGNCGFDFRYSIGSTQYAPMVQATAFSYQTWPTIDNTNSGDMLCVDDGSDNNGPYTNFNCFNENTYGQAFKPAASGVMSGFSMAMTCQAPSGSTSLVAALYESTTPLGENDAADASFVGSPLATASFTMSGCDTSWSGKAFTDADFSFPVMDFGAISLDSTKWYTVVFAGDAVAGSLPSGVSDPGATAAPGTPAARLATTGVNVDWIIVVGLLVSIAGSGFVAFSRRKRSA